MTLTDFLLTRIAEDEAGLGRFGVVAYCTDEDGSPTGRRKVSARVLAECGAKQQIVRWATNEGHPTWGIGPVLNLLALPYADHPDYREEWKP